jgi:hypothetical protein
MSFTLTRTSSFTAGAMWFRTSSARYCAISADAERQRSALISNDAIAVTMRLSLTTRAATGTVPSVSLQPVTAGSSSRPQACCRCPYAHVIFTVPEQLAPLALRNQRLFYNLLFRAASETLLEIAADPRHLGARIGLLAVLHTWSQNLGHHPHLHCLVPAGGLALDRSRWVRSRRNFFLPVRILSRMFRGKLLAFLKQSYRHNELRFSGSLAALSQPRAFHSLLSTLRNKEWVVYSKPPFGGPEHVLKYLARYTHRVAISNGRLLGLDSGQVRFRWRDSRHNNRSSVMTLDAVEFIRRFLLHALPAGFVKIRHFGLLANRNRSQALALCRIHLHATTPDISTLLTEPQKSALNRSCPQCKRGTLHVVPQHSSVEQARPNSLSVCAHLDSS